MHDALNPFCDAAIKYHLQLSPSRGASLPLVRQTLLPRPLAASTLLSGGDDDEVADDGRDVCEEAGLWDASSCLRQTRSGIWDCVQEKSKASSMSTTKQIFALFGLYMLRELLHRQAHARARCMLFTHVVRWGRSFHP